MAKAAHYFIQASSHTNEKKKRLAAMSLALAAAV